MAGTNKEEALARELAELPQLGLEALRERWRTVYGNEPPSHMSQGLLKIGLAYKLQENMHGGLNATSRKFLREVATGSTGKSPARQLKPGTILIREYQGIMHEVTVLERGAVYRGKTYKSLTALAQHISGQHVSGPSFFGLKSNAQR
jgi:hypothetical protein